MVYTITHPALPVLENSNRRLAVLTDTRAGLAYYFLLNDRLDTSVRPLAQLSLFPVDAHPNQYAARLYTSGNTYLEYHDHDYDNLVNLVRLAADDPNADKICGGWL